jgi:hypothetical protein
MADQDTDRWVFEVNAPEVRRWIEDNEGKIQFTDMMYRASAYKYMHRFDLNFQRTSTAGRARARCNPRATRARPPHHAFCADPSP